MAAVRDPFDLGQDVLDNTPWWIHDNRKGTERSLGFCNPFGYETDDMQVLGGIRPASSESYWWQCRNFAEARYWLTCVNGHRGRMKLCYGHAYQISTRMAGLCPPCGFPPRARELEEKANRLQREFWSAHPSERQWMAREMADCSAELDEMRARGIISTGAPLRLEEIS